MKVHIVGRDNPNRDLRAVIHNKLLYFTLESGEVGFLGEDGIVYTAPEYRDLDFVSVSTQWAHPVFTGDEVTLTF
ncbi:MAG: hypothetical protein COA78_20465 [Blastopirellula sp.]|nr:MAG: hypothetical protein COA78_20465 [Blastopirellula sp.]